MIKYKILIHTGDDIIGDIYLTRTDDNFIIKPFYFDDIDSAKDFADHFISADISIIAEQDNAILELLADVCFYISDTLCYFPRLSNYFMTLSLELDTKTVYSYNRNNKGSKNDTL